MIRQFVMMGVAGSGKSHIGAALAARLGMTYLEGDDFHPEANVEKMSRGEPLTDDDRWPWLEKVGHALALAPSDTIIGCSALKRRYRDLIRSMAPRSVFLFLDGDRALIAQRMAARDGHFMPLSLLDSQFAALEHLQTDEDHLTTPITGSPDDIVESFATQLAAGGYL